MLQESRIRLEDIRLERSLTES